MTEDAREADEQALDAHIRQVLAGPSAKVGGKTPPVPGDFSARVMAADRQRRRRRLLALVGIPAVAASLVIAVLVTPHGPPGAGAGSYLAQTRQEVALGDRGVAVLEAGSELAWSTDAGGHRWQQDRGNVFYRVEPGVRLRLHTPGGEVIVLGTCFRVEVNHMSIDRQGKIGFVAGAALAATVVVTVYEGRVRLASGDQQLQLGAGDQGQMANGTPPVRTTGDRSGERSRSSATLGARAPRLVTAPAEAGATEELRLLRQQLADQQAELDRLKVERGGTAEQHRYVDVGKDELLARAARCEIRYDTPPVLDVVPKTIRKNDLGGLTDTERDAFNEVITEMHGSVAAQLRGLYTEIGGEAAVAERMSPGSLVNELFQKMGPHEGDAARVRLSRERAGLQAPPADLSSTSPGERLFRLMFTMGDEFERKLGERIGAQRAHALRARRDGWTGGSRSSHSGCGKSG
jgi:hypothetical protein